MRIAVDATCWHNNRGYGRYTRSLLRALVRADQANSYTFFLDAPVQQEPLPPEAESRLVSASTPTALAASASGRRSLGDMWRMSRALSAPGFDLVLFPTVYSYVPVFSRARKVVMILDVIAEKFPHLTLPSWTARLFWKAKVGLGRWQASALLTLSEHSRRGIAEHFRIDPNRIHVVGAASDSVFRVVEVPQTPPCLQGLDGASRTVVYVGGFGPHKNLETLVNAFARLATDADLADVRLVLVGEYQKEVFHSYAGTIRRLVDQLGLSDRVVFTGYLSDEDLVLLLNRATVLVLPSLLEGFGLPAVEAAACGCPVIATTASPLPELLGEGGLFVNPHDQAGWERAILEVLRSPERRARMRDAGLEAARRLTWDEAARQLMTALRKVAA